MDGIDLNRKRRGAMAVLAAIDPEEAGRIAEEATRAIQRLVAQLDPDSIGEWFQELVEAA